MPNQEEIPPQEFKGNENGQAERSQSIKTLYSDVEDFVKSERPSLVSLLAREAQKPKLSYPQRTFASNKIKVAILAVFITLLFAALGWYTVVIILQKRPPPLPETPRVESLIKINTERQVIFTNASDQEGARALLKELAQRKEEAGTLTEIQFNSQNQTSVTPKEVLAITGVELSSEIADSVREVKLFLTYSFFGGRLVVVLAVSNASEAAFNLSANEPELLKTLPGLFLEENKDPFPAFENETYRNTDFRVSRFDPERDEVLTYAAIPSKKLVVLSTSQRGMELVMERIFQ